jgi:hypothetical protein
MIGSALGMLEDEVSVSYFLPSSAATEQGRKAEIGRKDERRKLRKSHRDEIKRRPERRRRRV